MKHPLKSKTVQINLLVSMLLLAETNLQILQPMLPVNLYALVAFALPMVNLVLRFVTTQGVSFGAKGSA